MSKVFISHSSKDKRFIRTLKEDLMENNISTWFDEDQLDIGDSLIDKLEDALNEMTHFLIVLSPDSVKSDWVNLELEKAIKRVQNKIIPIQYRECEIPNSLKSLLYYDLSKENVQVIDDRVKFTTDGYPHFLNKLIKTLRSPTEKKFTIGDKRNFHEQLEISENKAISKRDQIATLFITVNGYQNLNSKNNFKTRVESSTKVKSNIIKPIIFPRILKNVFKNIEIGQEVILSSDMNDTKQKCHFAGFRRDDSSITLPLDIQRKLYIKNHHSFWTRFDMNNNSIHFSPMELKLDTSDLS